ncbi:MAG TPA: OadG family protein [Lachnospiraceae bacterium]|nr:OadG family protein [Lachnospiraceae bacterium]
MKKLVAMLCMLTCVLGLSACGSEEVLSEVMQQRCEMAQTMATDFIVPYMTSFFDDALANDFQENFNVHEVEAIAEDRFSYALYYAQNAYGNSYDFNKIDVDGYAILNGIVSFNGTYASLGDIDISQGLTATSKVSGDEIIVTVPLTGSVKDSNGNFKTANVEIIFSNDIFLTVNACALNIVQTMGGLMTKAAADTLMGMGTVFVVLILISFIIYGLGFIPRMQEKTNKKSKKEEMQAIKTDAVNNTIAQIIEMEERVEYTDDLQLIAVIAAAIAASTGAQNTDGFVVRSIRKRR